MSAIRKLYADLGMPLPAPGVRDWLDELPPRDPETPALSEQLVDAAQDLADRVTSGEFGELEVEQRMDLRFLALSMSRWADEARGIEMALADARLREAGWLPRPGRLARLIRRLGRA